MRPEPHRSSGLTRSPVDTEDLISTLTDILGPGNRANGKNCILVIRSDSDLRDGVSSCAHRCPHHCVQNKNHKVEQWSSADEENEKLVSFPSQARENLPSLLPAVLEP